MLPTYYFHLRGEGFEVPDLQGQVCADDVAARAEAERLAVELAETARSSRNGHDEAVIEVVDADLRPVLALPLRDAKG